MAYRAIKARFKLENGSSPSTLTDISTYLDQITSGSSGQTVDGTTFQPDATVPLQIDIPTFSQKSFTLSGKWTEASEAFFAPIEGLQHLRYEFGPTGSTAGMKKISGYCNVKEYSGPINAVAAVISFTVTLTVLSRDVGVWP